MTRRTCMLQFLDYRLLLFIFLFAQNAPAGAPPLTGWSVAPSFLVHLLLICWGRYLFNNRSTSGDVSPMALRHPGLWRPSFVCSWTLYDFAALTLSRMLEMFFLSAGAYRTLTGWGVGSLGRCRRQHDLPAGEEGILTICASIYDYM